MTTAARPTFEPARGGRGKGEGDLSALSKQYSSRDLPSHTKLKYSSKSAGLDNTSSKLLRISAPFICESIVYLFNLSISSGIFPDMFKHAKETEQKLEEERIRTENILSGNPLLQGQQKIDFKVKKRPHLCHLHKPMLTISSVSAADKRRETEQKLEEERIRTENILSGNPLLQGQQKIDFKVKKRWDDDVVFKNCARGEDDKKDGKFINDTLRSDFHKKFMEKYIK
ncbi:protein CWC15 homolog [Saccoglossus kowalevskii]|uniref:Protein CWC15 homolog A-like n=1 Tax=Saccoglossus kowalevskii TaxID=10224 RepID=A0ABM0MV95_SACKO|nr:PREDICTED: protein CWC15 homolog A-like [Saccoglossus kowalevskii]